MTEPKETEETNRQTKFDSTHISLLMYSNRFSTLALASAESCGTSEGPTSLYMVLWDFNRVNS